MADKKLTAKEQMAENNKRMQAKREAASAPRKASTSKEVVKPSSAKESMAASNKRMAARRDAVNAPAPTIKSTTTKTTFGTSGLPKSNPLSIPGMSKSMTSSATPSAKPSAKPSSKAASGPPNTQITTVSKPDAPAKSKGTAPAAKRIVSKAELEKSGMSLRDFLNKERGLTRRADPVSKAPLKELEEIDVLTGKKKMAKGGLTRKKNNGY